MTYAAWTEDGLDWYFAIGPTFGLAVAFVGGAVALVLMARERRRD